MEDVKNETLVRPIRGNKDSPLHELMGIAPTRKDALETTVLCQNTGEPPKSNLEVLTSIKESVQSTREFAYAMFYWGSLQNIPPALSAEDEDDIDIDNPLVM